MNKIKISAVKFQDMVARATKGASENKLLPITSMMCIEMKDHVLSLTTTDTSNTLVIKADKIEGDDMYAVVPVKQFRDLVARITSDSISMELVGGDLNIEANGKYKIPLLVDEDGVVQFPAFKFEKKGEGEVINLSSIKNILDINKACVAKTIDTPCLCGYYLGEQVITTDENTICFNDMKLTEEPYLISTEMMELLALSKQEKISWWYADGFFYFETEDMILHGVEHDGKDLFPAEDVMGYLDTEFKSSCRLPKLAIQDLISRLAVFIEPYDKNGAYFTFTKEGVKVNSKKSNSDELIPYLESKDFAPFVCCVDIPMMKGLIDANPGESVDIWYGNEACIKMTSGKVTQVIALLEDEGLESIQGE